MRMIHSLYIYHVATFTTVSIVSKRLITPVIIMLPPCSSSLVSSSHSSDETITNRHPRNDALALLSPPSVVLQKGGRGNAVARARCLSLVDVCLLFSLFFCLLYFEFCLTWESRERRCLSFICCRITLKYFIMFNLKKY